MAGGKKDGLEAYDKDLNPKGRVSGKKEGLIAKVKFVLKKKRGGKND